MEDLGRIHQIIVPFFGHNMTFNLEVMIMTWIVISALLCFGFLAAQKKSLLPSPLQVVGELFVVHLFALTEDALGEELSKKYAPLICALFMFLLLSNWLGIIP
ncbi:MAG: F0F1 ATP synthase subunit A, partial [Deltaproteobacteria bacterium]|nr:F0F1 ATP synthase subunit A [Deltaproteobacteria bacterium]